MNCQSGFGISGTLLGAWKSWFIMFGFNEFFLVKRKCGVSKYMKLRKNLFSVTKARNKLGRSWAKLSLDPSLTLFLLFAMCYLQLVTCPRPQLSWTWSWGWAWQYLISMTLQWGHLEIFSSIPNLNMVILAIKRNIWLKINVILNSILLNFYKLINKVGSSKFHNLCFLFIKRIFNNCP